MSTDATLGTQGAWMALVALCAIGGWGCVTQRITCSPVDLSGCVIDDVVVIGNDAVDSDDIEEKIATAETGGAFEGVPLIGAVDALTVEYERFDRFVLERDLQRVARLYRAKGYYDAVVRAGRVRRIDAHVDPEDVRTSRLLVEIVVEEGKPVLTLGVDLSWRDWNPTLASDVAAAALNAKNRFPLASVFTEERYLETAKAILRGLTDLGYAYARVEPSADVDLQKRRALVRYAIEIGPRCTFGKVDLVGLGEIPEWQIRPALGFEEGDEYSTSKLESAEVALNEFGVFGAISIEQPSLAAAGPRPTAVPIRIVVQPSKLRALRIGGGLELGSQVAARGLLGWQNRNFFGALDRVNIEARPRLVVYPWKMATLFATEPRLVPEVLVRLEYTLPIPYDPRTSFYVQGQGAVGLQKNHDAPDAITDLTDIPGEYIAEQKVGLSRDFFLSRLVIGLSHNLSFSQPFSYNLPETLGPRESLLLSYLSTYAELDFRRRGKKWEPAQPTSGFFLAADTQVAGHFIGGDADDVKVLPEGRFYAPLTRKLVLAGRFAMGFLITGNYAAVLDDDVAPGDVLAGGDAALRARLSRDVQILDKRGLFSGGPNSNRGYGFNEIAPHRVVDSDGNSIVGSPDAIGGRTLWEASAELRFPIAGALGGSVFVDASDVTRGIGELRINHPHVASGAGIRYETPVGPLRVDLGVRIPYLQVAGEAEQAARCVLDLTVPCTQLVLDEGQPSKLLGLPAAVAVAIGNAF